MGKSTKYWKGLEELSNSPEFVKHQQNEFTEEVPVDQFLGSGLLEHTNSSRRDFLKFLGFSVATVSLAACETPVNKAIPYVVKPEEITPGVANWYASTFFDGHDYASILVKTREGRPIKIEGNDLSKVTNGGTNARVQASVLSLYDSSRLKAPMHKDMEAKWEAVDKSIIADLEKIAAAGGNIRILSGTIISPSTRRVFADFAAKYPTTRHITYDAVSYSAINRANGHTFEKSVLPTYHFDKAKVIVSIGADFLGNWISPIEFASQYGKGRKINREKAEMSKHIQFEANMSLTGANADDRFPVKPSEYGKIVVAIYNAVAKATGGAMAQEVSLPKEIQTAVNSTAKWLLQNKKQSLVVCGVNDVHTQVVVNGINQLLENYDNTIDIKTANHLRQGNDAEFINLVNEMKAGKVAAIITYNTNPVYTAPTALKFAEAYKKVGLRISLADRQDETAILADYTCPDHHYLESWNDANPADGRFSLTQPTIAPIFSAATGHEGTRQAQESLLKWAGIETDFHSYIQKHWEAAFFPQQNSHAAFTSFWNTALQNGVYEFEVAETAAIAKANEKDKKKTDNKTKSASSSEASTEAEHSNEPKMDFATAAAQLLKKETKASNWELALYEKVGMGDGTHANNPWLHELPDPVTKVTWDNYVTMSPIDMKSGKYKLQERQDREASVIEITLNGTAIKLPVYPQPGQALGTIGIALGYGRTNAGGLSKKEEVGVIGQNAYAFVQVEGNEFNFNVSNVTLSPEISTTELAATQIHHTIMGRNLIRETTLEEYKKDKKSGNVEEELTTHVGKKDPVDVTLWDNHERPGHWWGMLIDLNACIGCGSCVVSCTAENNVPVVGKDQVIRTREMHWLRIDRYYSSDLKNKEEAEEKKIGLIEAYLEMENPTALNPKVVFQPIMCQHCNHAPCETVCPVLATNHSSEGLNQMTYNRCVGTRYCANNCPFKVRRFNWFNYIENDKFAGINPSQDDLGRMVLNPDVVVRSRGVMEKCSMCVQRLQSGKLEAKKAMHKLADGSIKTACQQSCPTNAIVFGDINDKSSAIATERANERNYFMLHELNIASNVSYLTKVRNIEPEVKEHEGATEEKKESVKTEEKKAS